MFFTDNFTARREVGQFGILCNTSGRNEETAMRDRRRRLGWSVHSSVSSVNKPPLVVCKHPCMHACISSPLDPGYDRRNVSSASSNEPTRKWDNAFFPHHYATFCSHSRSFILSLLFPLSFLLPSSLHLPTHCFVRSWLIDMNSFAKG